MKFIIRNDDIAYDTTLDEIRTFCEICDKYGFKIIQAITIIGEVQKISHRNSNNFIKDMSSIGFWENNQLVRYLRERSDYLGVHGFWHTHEPLLGEIEMGKRILQAYFDKVDYFIPPFNEGLYKETVADLKLCQLSRDNGECLEDFLESGTPTAPIMYLHSWRFKGKPYTFDQLDRCLDRLSKV